MKLLLSAAICSLLLQTTLIAQETPPPVSDSTEAVPADSAGSDPVDRTEAIKEKANETVQEIARTVDESQEAKEAAAGILKPIYQLAEQMSFPAFHWVAFGLMVAGVVSFALQLVIGKLVVLANMGFSLAEILSDAFGLVISLIGLVLTTQAATENSTFTQSPAAVLSATLLGAILGFVLYRWGQRSEKEAAKGRMVESLHSPQETKNKK